MQTFNQLYTRFTKITSDTSTDNIAFGKQLINEGQKLICGSNDWKFCEETNTVTTTASMTVIPLPVNHRKLKTWYLTSGGIKYTPREMANPIMFDNISSQGTQTSDFPSYFHIRNNQILVYPAIATASNTVTIVSLIRPIDMVNADYSTDVVTDITSGDTTVEGGTVAWSTATNAKVGSYIKFDATGTNPGDEQWYKIASITDADTLELATNYEGTTVASGSVNYTIAELPLIPEEFQNILIYYAAMNYYMMKEDDNKVSLYKSLYDEMFRTMKREFASITTQYTIEDREDIGFRNPNFYPQSLT